MVLAISDRKNARRCRSAIGHVKRRRVVRLFWLKTDWLYIIGFKNPIGVI